LAGDNPILINCTILGNNIISGGTYKLEGSILVLLINVINIIVLMILIKNTKDKNKSNCA
jgi:hypothetical protein